MVIPYRKVPEPDKYGQEKERESPLSSRDLENIFQNYSNINNHFTQNAWCR
uniref:Uncharacterized protein n=1 Tax=Anguilla anguilla TaxID=7936 RepID=A0A0E9UL95_ANGAN